MKANIAADLLVSQVRNTASWLWELPETRHVADVLVPTGAASLRVMLAAHYATVATFVPTDVDARIRHHAWAAIESADELAAACAVVDEVGAWDARAVSERVVTSPHGPISGHDGEWLAVRAGALGRAAALDEELVRSLAAAIDTELDREERILRWATRPEDALAVATIVAHNLGDLSRVVEQWPNLPALAPLRPRYSRLGHEDSARSPFRAAGVLNKSFMARENHRFLALRRARGLRSARALLLPIGPWFDAWGETIAQTAALEDDAKAEVVEALLEIHVASPSELGCLRALAGIERKTRGGIATYAHRLPARLRKEIGRGRVREEIDVSPSHFAARIAKRSKAS